jgi:catechol 2,3-dioxygenase-like lactoylglutathione lyase family enzyme
MHFGICVRDLERSIRFYRDGLGFREAGRLEVAGEPTATLLGLPELTLHAVYLDREGFRIELLYYPQPGCVGSAEPRPMNQLGLTHMALRVTSLEEAIRAVEDNGGRVLEGTRVENEVYSSKIVYATDPDGTRLEIIETPQDPTR